MEKTSNEVIVERIDGMKEHFNLKIGNLNKNINCFKKDFKKYVAPEIKANYEFRVKGNTIIGAVAFICTAFGGFLMWSFSKFKFWERGN